MTFMRINAYKHFNYYIGIKKKKKSNWKLVLEDFNIIDSYFEK